MFAWASPWLLVAFACMPHGGHAAALVPQGFVDELYAGGIGRPTAMEFTPDGRLFVLEQTGSVRVISAGGVLQATPFATLKVDASGERGLLGITFDPSFSRNQYVYLYYTVPGTPAHNRVSRFTANGNVAVAGSETVLLDLDALSATATFHNGGTLQFGTDGKLYIAVGDNTNYANGQSLTTRLGKMLRINADGTIPADNPTTFPGIAGSTSGLNRAIYAVGLRNPFKFAVQPTTGKWFINDVGENTWEEINAGGRGLNYGWSVSEGPTTNPDFKSPVFYYPHSGPAPSGCAITGGAFYDPPEGRHTVRGAGADIGGASDSFQLVHQSLSGDGSITARVATSNPTDPLAKVGVMIRAGLGAGAQHALMALTPDGGARLLSRAAQGGATSTVQGPSVTTPYWVRVTRSGNVFSGSVSPDGNTWTPVGSVTIAMGSSVVAGLAVTSRDAQTLNTAVFDHVTLSQGASSTDWASTDIGSPALAGSYDYVKSQFPDSYSGDYFFVDYCSGWIYSLDSQNPANATSFATD
ncbi:MAG: PQQ-dependent sugar dehydrogenase [Methylotetracoccus sp.]